MKVRRREQDIVDATRALFDERGMQEVPIDDIARAVGLSRALIYRHFSSKEELLILTVTRYLARATNVYYVTDGDRNLYDHEICSLIVPCAAPAVPAADTKPPPRRGRAIAVTGDCPLDKPCCPAAGKPCIEPEGKAEPKAKAKSAKGGS